MIECFFLEVNYNYEYVALEASHGHSNACKVTFLVSSCPLLFKIFASAQIRHQLFPGSLLLHSSHDDFQKVGSHLAQRLFDSVPQVRLQVSVVAADLLLNWRFGESNAPLLIPLLLTRLAPLNLLLALSMFMFCPRLRIYACHWTRQRR